MPTNVTVKLTIGIPSEVVFYRDPILGSGGAFNGGTKCDPAPVIDLDRSGAASMTVPMLAWGTTLKYDDANALAVAGKPAWYRALRPGSVAIQTGSLQRKPENLDVLFAKMSGATHAVKFVVNGPNPLLSEFAPDIDADITVGLRKAAGGIEYAVEGEHDGFPNYTLQINGKTVYVSDCVAKNLNPTALGGLVDQDVEIGWTKL